MKNKKFVGKNTKSHYFSKSGGANAAPCSTPNDVPYICVGKQSGTGLQI